MATAKTATLTPDVVTAVTIDVAQYGEKNSLVVINQTGTGVIWARIDGTDPTVKGDSCFPIFDKRVFTVNDGDGSAVIKLIASTAIEFTVEAGPATEEISSTGTFNAPRLTADPDSPTDGDIWYRTDTDAYRVRRNGVTETLLTNGQNTIPQFTGADPVSPANGDIWFRSDLLTLNIRRGTATETILTSSYNPDGGGSGGGGGTVSVPASPGELLHLGTGDGMNHWNLGIGRESGHVDITPTSLQSGYTNSPYFKLNADKTAVTMRAPVSGGTTSENTQYARVEFREFNEAANDEIDFDCHTGTHWMKGHTKIVHLAPTKPWVVVAQLHDDDDDVVKIMTRVVSGVTKLMLTVRDNTISTPLLETIAEGDSFSWEIKFVNGTMTVYINDTLKHTDSTSFDTTGEGDHMYFKAGCYNQSNESTEEDEDEYFEIELKNLQHWHTGWPTPLAHWEPVLIGGDVEEDMVGTWTAITLGTNTASRSGMPTTSVRKEGEGTRAFMRGGLDITGSISSGAVIGVIPSGFRPSYTVTVPGRFNSGTAVLTIESDGNIRLANSLSSSGWVTFDNVNWGL